MTQLGPSPSVVELLSGAVRSLSLACALGAPQAHVDAATARLQRFQAPPKPKKRRRKPRSLKKLQKRLKDHQTPHPSAWDPEPISLEVEASQCRALLLDIVRRAIHDWVLYRYHSKLALREVANEAKVWLFDEKPGHPWWEIRAAGEMRLTSFLGICELLDVDPILVRHRARLMTIQDIRTAGRPPERRKSQIENSSFREHPVTNDVDFGQIDRPEPGRFQSNYEAHFYVGSNTSSW